MQRTELFAGFVGLGNNCEFGAVLDAASEGTLNAGLFHAVGFPRTQQLIKAIEAGLAGMFEDGFYTIARPPDWPDYAIDCWKYGFRFHTGVLTADDRPELKLGKRLAALRYRKNLFLESLRLGEKVFVYRSNEPFKKQIALDLFRVIRLHGPGTLLHVHEDPAQRSGIVEEHENGLFCGVISRLWSGGPALIDFAAWENIARIVVGDNRRRIEELSRDNQDMRAASRAGAAQALRSSDFGRSTP